MNTNDVSPAKGDPLAPLLELPDVAEQARRAQDAVFAVHRTGQNLRGGAVTGAEASVRAARASAAIAGADPEIPADATVTDPLLAGALRAAEALEGLLPVWRRAPAQTLAKLHVLIAADLGQSADDLGRPRAERDVGQRLELLGQLITGATSAPAPVLTAVVHGELLTLCPFGSGDGVLARAAARLSMVATGLDPKALTVPEVHYYRHQARYRQAAAGFASATPDGLREWLLFCLAALRAGAKEARGIAEAAG